MNPNGVVPTIIHDEKIIYESAVIDEYLDDVFPEPALRSTDPYERSLMRRWVKQLDEGLHAASATISACIAFRYQFIEGKTSEELQKTLDGYVNPEKRRRMTENVLEGVDSKFFKPAIARIVKMLDEMEADLYRYPWIAGGSYSLADIALTPYVTRVVHLKQDWLFDTRPRVAAWFTKICARHNYEIAMRQWFIDDFITLMASKGKENEAGVKKVIQGAV